MRIGKIWPGSSDVPADRDPEDLGLPAGEDPEEPFGDPHVPVGLGARGHLSRVVGAVLPHRVDRQEPAHEGGDAEDDEEVAAGLRRVDRHHREADDVLLGPAGAGPLGVLLVHEQHHVRADERQQQPGDQQHVGYVEPRDDHVAGELAAEHEERHVGADDGSRLDQAVRDPQPGARQQVVGEGVAREPLEDAEEQEHAADHPVQLTRLAEGSGDEDADQVDEHRGDEEHRRPVVHLPHEQAATDVEGDVEGRGVGLRHVQTAVLLVGAFVDDLAHARLVPKGEEHAGEEQDDEAPQRDLAQHERPVVGEDLADLLLGGRRRCRRARRPSWPPLRPWSACQASPLTWRACS